MIQEKFRNLLSPLSRPIFRSFKLSCYITIKDYGSLTRKEVDELLWNMVSDLLDEKQKKRRITYIIERMKTKKLICIERKRPNSNYNLPNCEQIG